MLNVIMLNVIMLNVVMLNVVAPIRVHQCRQDTQHNHIQHDYENAALSITTLDTVMLSGVIKCDTQHWANAGKAQTLYRCVFDAKSVFDIWTQVFRSRIRRRS
jgi:hypothetical protein